MRHAAERYGRIWLKPAGPPVKQADPALLRVLTQHRDAVLTVAFLSDGKTLASGSGDWTIRLWNVESGEPEALLVGSHLGYICSIASSARSQTLVSGGSDDRVTIWDTESRAIKGILQGRRGSRAEVRSVALPSDEKLIAIAATTPNRSNVTFDGPDDILLWNLEKRSLERTLKGHSNWVYSLAFSPDDRTLASASADETVRLWETETGKCRTLNGHGAPGVAAVAFSPDGQIVASGGWDKTVRLWKVATGACMRVLKGHSSNVTSVAFSPDSQMVASGSGDQTVRLWNVHTAECTAILEGHRSTVASIAFSREGKILASGSYDKTVRLWDVQSVTERRTSEGHSRNVFLSATSDTENALATGPNDDKAVATDAPPKMWVEALEGLQIAVRSTAQSHDHSAVAVASQDGQLLMLDLEKKKRKWARVLEDERRTLDAGQEIWPDDVASIAFSPDDGILATGHVHGRVWLWDARTGECIATFDQHHEDFVCVVLFSPDGKKILASGSIDGTVRLWDVQLRECKRTLETPRQVIGSIHPSWVRGRRDKVVSVGFSPDSQMVASGIEGGRVNLWDIRTGQLLAWMPCEATMPSVRFDPTLPQLHVADYSGTAHVPDNYILEIVRPRGL